MDDWKLIVYPQIKKVDCITSATIRLRKTISPTKPNKVLVLKLFSRLLAQQKQMGDTLDLEAIFPKL